MRHQLVVLLIALAREPVDVPFDIANELAAQPARFGFIGECDQALVAGQRHLRIDDHRAALRQHDDDVRLLQAAAVVPEAQAAALRDVFAAFVEPGRFENAFERNLAPSAEELRISSQSLGQAIGLTADGIAGLDQPLDLVFEGSYLAVFRFVGGLDLILKILNPFAQRVEN